MSLGSIFASIKRISLCGTISIRSVPDFTTPPIVFILIWFTIPSTGETKTVLLSLSSSETSFDSYFFISVFTFWSSFEASDLNIFDF